jgi:hypothetical protein
MTGPEKRESSLATSFGCGSIGKVGTKKIHKSMRIIMPHNGKSKNNNAYPALPWGMENLSGSFSMEWVATSSL